MRVFRWKKPKPTPYPLGLTADDIESLAPLRGNRHFVKFQRVLREVCELRGEHLLAKLDLESYHYTRGYIQALRDTITLVDDILNRKDEIDAERERRGSDTAKRDWRSAFFGGPWYDTARRVLDRRSRS